MLEAFESGADPESQAPPWAVPGGNETLRPPRRAPRPPAVEPADEPELTAEPAPDRRRRRSQSGRLRIPGRSRVAAARRRRSRRRLVTWGGAAIVLVFVVGAVIYLTSSAPVKSPYVIALQPGEFSTVPDACRAVSAATLSQYLAGTPKSTQPFAGQQQSQCAYTVDHQPTFRLLNVTAQAYPVFAAAPGDGSATANAAYNYGLKRQQLASPPKHAPANAATISPLAGFGNAAFSAVQTLKAGSITDDRVTVLARYRNVLITVSLQAQSSAGFGPVSVTELQAGALAAARELLAAVKAEPTVGG